MPRNAYAQSAGCPPLPAPEWRCDACLPRPAVIKDNSVWSSPQPVSLLVSSSCRVTSPKQLLGEPSLRTTSESTFAVLG